MTRTSTFLGHEGGPHVKTEKLEEMFHGDKEQMGKQKRQSIK